MKHWLPLMLGLLTLPYHNLWSMTAQESYQQAAKIYLEDLQNEVKRRRDEPLKRIESYYKIAGDRLSKSISDSNVDLEMELRNYLKDYPHHATTPYAHFQLGSLYFKLGEQDAIYLEQAEVQFQKLINNWPKFAYREEAYYLLAYSRLQRNQEKNAVDVFNELAKLYPKSRFLPEVRLRLGEYYFHNARYAQAIPFYQAVASEKNAQNELQNKASYKLAWTYYLTGNYPQARQRFTQVAQLGKEGEFYREAVDFAALSLKRQQVGDRAVSMLSGSKSSEAELAILARYGALLKEDGKFEQAATLYLAMPGSLALRNAATALAEGGQAKRAAELDALFIKKYPELNELNRAALFELASYEYATRAGGLDLAKMHFSTLVRDYPGSREAYEAQYFLAESQYQQQEYGAAAHNYQLVLQASQYDQHFDDALNAVIVCHEKRLKAVSDPKQRVVVAKELLLALDDQRKRGRIKASRVELLFRSAEILSMLDRHDQALGRYNQVVQEYPESPLSRDAAFSVIGLLFKLNRPRDVIDWTQSFRKQHVDDNEWQHKMQAAQWDARLAIADGFEKSGQLIDAAGRFAAIAKRDLNNPQSEPVLRKSINLFEKIRQPQWLLDSYQAYVNAYPQSRLTAELRKRLIVEQQNYLLKPIDQSTIDRVNPALEHGEQTSQLALQTPLTKQGKINPQKLKLVAQADQQLVQVAKTGKPPWNSAALFALSQLYQKLAIEVESLDAGLGKQLRSKAVLLHRRNLELAKRQTGLREWPWQALQELASVDPNKYRDFNKLSFPYPWTPQLPPLPENTPRSGDNQPYLDWLSQVPPNLSDQLHNNQVKLLRAALYRFNQQPNAAIPLYREHLRQWPESASWQLELAAALIEAKQYDEAVELLRPLYFEQTAAPTLLARLATALDYQGNHDAAEQLLTQNLPNNKLSSDESAWQGLFALYYHRQWLAELYQLSSKISPQNPELRNNINLLYSAMGESKRP